MWWSVPAGRDSFSTWRETSTVYHEGVPGHHLQCGQAAYRSDRLNRWRRLGCWVSGHGEGWALYAERLMEELGYLADDGDLMGMLDAHALRAARVVVDIGVHCGLAAPQEVGGGDLGRRQGVGVPAPAHPRSPTRSCGSSSTATSAGPGQAISYKVGERAWLDLRRQVGAPGRTPSTCGLPPPRARPRLGRAGRASAPPSLSARDRRRAAPVLVLASASPARLATLRAAGIDPRGAGLVGRRGRGGRPLRRHRRGGRRARAGPGQGRGRRGGAVRRGRRRRPSSSAATRCSSSRARCTASPARRGGRPRAVAADARAVGVLHTGHWLVDTATRRTPAAAARPSARCRRRPCTSPG